MKVSELIYERVTLEHMTHETEAIIHQIQNASCVEDVLNARTRYNQLCVEYSTASALSYMRYTINTIDEFYLAEKDYYDEISPQVANLDLAYNQALMSTQFLPQLREILNPLLFKSLLSMAVKTH